MRIGSKRFKGEMTERSINGYTLTVASKYAGKLKRAKQVILSYDGLKFETTVKSVTKAERGTVRVALNLKRDLTKPPNVAPSFFSRFFRRRRDMSHSAATATVAYGGIVLILFSLLALPGLGDRLGTADRIESALKWCLNSASKQIDDWNS